MKQSRFMSLTESIINIAVGFGIACIAQAIFLPLLGVPIPWAANFAFAGIMTAISIGRSFLLRRLFEALHIRNPLSPGAIAIVAERRRQIEQEGWTAEHDRDHEQGELALAGAAYAEFAAFETGIKPPRNFDDEPLRPDCWPWSPAWWKPQGFRRDLVKAGALILAELDRFDRDRRSRPQTVKASPLPPIPANREAA